MARKRNKRHGQRVDFSNARLLLARSNSLLSDIEDRRLFYPERARPARGLSKHASVIGIAPVPKTGAKRVGGKYKPDVFRFNVPEKVAVCVRRKERREVLFALKKRGKGSRSRRLRNEFSDVSCR